MKQEIIIDNGTTILLDTEKTPKALNYEGSNYISTSILDNDDVYIDSKDSIQNTVRTGSNIDEPHVERLAAAIQNKGIDYTYQPPYAFKEDVTCPKTGKKYKYRLKKVGNHRKHAFKKVGAKKWIYHIYEPFLDKFLEIDAAFLTNDHSPALLMTKNAVINKLNQMVEAKRWGQISKPKLEEVLKTWLTNHCSSMHPNSHSAIIKQVFHSNAEYTDHVEYTPKEAEQWVTSYTDRKTDFELDKKRSVHGTVVGEGYEKKKIMLAIMKFGETKNPTEFVGHVKQPLSTDKNRSTTKLKRKAMVQTFKDIESDLDSVFKYKKENGVYPFKLVSFIAQDRKNQENFEKEQTL